MQKVLLVQGSTVDTDAVNDALVKASNPPYRVIRETCCGDAISRLQALRQAPRAEHVAALLVDLVLPDSTGIETFDRLHRAAPQVPMLVLTAAQDEEIAKLAVQRGAQEYLLKDPLEAHLLPKTVRNMIERAANI